MWNRSRISSLFFLGSAFALVACKGEVKQITFTGPYGTTIEYRVEPQGVSGQVTLPQGINGMGEAAVAINAEAEKLLVNATHPQAYDLGSPTLNVELSQGGVEKTFSPAVAKTSLLLSRETSGARREANCKNLVEANGSGGNLHIMIQGPYSLGDCEDNELRYNDPLWAGKPRGIGGGSNYFSEEDDRALGMDFVNNFNAKNGHLLVKDSQVFPYLQNMMDHIAARSDAPHVRPRVHFINADVVNAFALPGGPVYVFRGIMEHVRDENELIGILGHEWAHVAARHGTRNMTKAINTQIAAIGLVLALELSKYRDQPNEAKRQRDAFLASIAQQLTMVGAQAIIMGGTRDNEREADTLGAQYAYRVGFSPNGVGSFFASLGGASGFWLDSLFSSHPDHSERVSNNNRNIDSYFPRNARSLPMNSQEFGGIRLAMRDMPPMLRGQEANKVLALQFVKTNQEVAFKNVNGFFQGKFGK